MIHYTICDRCGAETTYRSGVTVSQDVNIYEFKLCGRCALDAIRTMRALVGNPPDPQDAPWTDGAGEAAR